MKRRFGLSWRLLAFIATILQHSASAHAQSSIVSAAPETVSVTLYRDPNRGFGGAIDLEALQGFALITETRTITVPEGQADIRFEGVASGIIPVSAIVTGLPGGVIQKNRDARLLSPAALVDGSYGRIIHLKRTNRQTGKVIEEDATLVAGPVGGVIVKTKTGIEVLGCAGLPETQVYDGLPSGLTSKPTLSVTTRSPHTTTATVKLSYLASGFDWAANYVARVRADGKSLDLFAWLTLANSNAESFVDAETQAVAGKLSRDNDAQNREPTAAAPQVSLHCWPADITSTHPRWDQSTLPPPPVEPASPAYEAFGEIIVTATRRSESLQSSPVSVITHQEELGDLKLYRIPIAVTVAANAQKQVAMINKENVPFERLYTARLYQGQTADEPQMMAIMLRMENKSKRGLGLPMPFGMVAVFEQRAAEPLWVGETGLRDTAVDEKVELVFGKSSNVRWTSKELQKNQADENKHIERYSVTLTNANPEAVSTEILLDIDTEENVLVDSSAKLGRKFGKPLWLAKIPANGNLTLSYAYRPIDDN